MLIEQHRHCDIDDATSRLMWVKSTGAESPFAYFEALREYLGRYGKPLALHSDKASIFRINKPQAVKGPMRSWI